MTTDPTATGGMTTTTTNGTDPTSTTNGTDPTGGGGDAMFCQRDLSHQVVEAGGHYLWKVDDNQPQLKAAIESAFEPARSPLRAASPGRGA